MSRSTVFAEPRRLGYLAAVALLGLIAGCGPATVKVEGSFPAPLIETVPLSMGVWYSPDFANHEFFEESKRRGESSWLVSTGAAQVQMWDGLLAGLFEEYVRLQSAPGSRHSPAGLDAFLAGIACELRLDLQLPSR
ncbi:MAG: hypothetical protein HRT77_12445 [Halioglobus sp.]|nr:hypothetical protein [Halioglobus sp.]